MAAAIAASFVAAPVFAQGYVGLGVGSSSLSNADGTENGTTYSGGNASKTSMKIFGGYQITPMWGIEAQYSDLGKRTYTETSNNTQYRNDFNASQFSVAATGTLPLGSDFALIGKLGASANSIKFSDGKESTIGLLFGIGASYKLTPAIAIRAEYEDFGKFSKNSGNNGKAIKGNNFSVGMQYSF